MGCDRGRPNEVLIKGNGVTTWGIYVTGCDFYSVLYISSLAYLELPSPACMQTLKSYWLSFLQANEQNGFFRIWRS